MVAESPGSTMRRARTAARTYTRPVDRQAGRRDAGTPAREERLERYAGGRFRQVPGFLNEVAADLIVRIGAAQVANGITGSVAEIGVFAGRTTTLLYLLTFDPERMVGMDLFEDGRDASGHPAASEAQIRATVTRFAGDASRLSTIKSDSTLLAAEALLAAAGGMPFRIFHIDGDHRGAAVGKDLDLALGTLAPGGVIIADDVFNSNTPEVFEAVAAFVARSEDVVPFATAATKMFLCRRADADLYLGTVKAAGNEETLRTWEVFGARVHSLRQVGPQRPKPVLSTFQRFLRRGRRSLKTLRRRLPWRKRR